MKPLDPRLVRSARAVRVHLAVTVISGVAVTGLVLAQAWLLAHTIAGAARGAGLDELSWAVTAVAGVAIARGLTAYGAETAALRSAARAKSQLRRTLVAHVTGTGPDATSDAQGHGAVWLARQEGSGSEPGQPRAGELVTLATRGLDALDDYFARYLPQLVLAALVPLAVVVVVIRADWISGVIIAVTLPLIPIFMALVGWHTQARTQRQWHLLNRLGGHFLDVVEGLPTLAIFRRAKAQAGIIRRITDEHRHTTMATLRVAFLSAFVLELLATLAVALVAVEVGIRLMYGTLDYETALLVLILAPEAYLPLREVGARFHASMEGVAAAEQVFRVMDEHTPGPGGVRQRGTSDLAGGKRASGDRAPHPDPVVSSRDGAGAAGGTVPRDTGGSGAPEQGGLVPTGLARDTATRIHFDGAGLVYPGRENPALHEVSLSVDPGRSMLVTGPSGAGKSSLLSLLLRFTEPTSGQILLQETAAPEGTGPRAAPGTAAAADWAPLATVPVDEWRRRIAWVPQHPYLFDDTVAGNIQLGAPDTSLAEVRQAAGRAEADAFVRALPEGYQTRLGERGTRLSAGQRQRIALARAFLRDAPLVLLDEPTAHLDPENAAAIRATVLRLLRGRTGVIVAHDTGWAPLVDEVVRLDAGHVVEPEAPS